MSFVESEERIALRAAVTELAGRFGPKYLHEKAVAHQPPLELWAEAGKAGFIGVNIPTEYGGGGAGIYELALVLEELGANGCPLLMLVVSPAICGTIISRFGRANST